MDLIKLYFKTLGSEETRIQWDATVRYWRELRKRLIEV